jgi:hypothetical protein
LHEIDSTKAGYYTYMFLLKQFCLLTMFQVIQCRLVANANTRQKLWQLMADKNTPLINELLLQVAQHPYFETWRHKGKLPTGIVKQLCDSLKSDPRFAGQPARFFTSALVSANQTYQSWLALMKRSQFQLEGKMHWLEMLKSDAELVEASGVSLETLRIKASEILAQFTPQSDTVESKPGKGKKRKKTKKSKGSEGGCKERTLQERSLYTTLFEIYRNTEDSLTCCAIRYSLLFCRYSLVDS